MVENTNHDNTFPYFLNYYKTWVCPEHIFYQRKHYKNFKANSNIHKDDFFNT